MIKPNKEQLTSAFFITFSGNCKKALSMYQNCFGGKLYFKTFEKPIEGFSEQPIISGSLTSNTITIYGSDLVHEEGRMLGNYLSIYLQCNSYSHRVNIIEKLGCNVINSSLKKDKKQKLIEVTDAFNVKWILGV